jgi:gliding motility associated protien GldN
MVTNRSVKAQDVKTEVYVTEHIPYKKPVPYPYVREADVIWSKVIWRIIDLREKQNLPLFYPSKPIGKRMNLTDLLLFGIDNEGLTAYSTDDDLNEFKIPMTKLQIDAAFDAGVDTTKIQNINTGEMEDKVVMKERQTSEIKQLLVKGKWYFDKQHSTMKVRILGICPIRVYYRLDDQGLPTEDIVRRLTFWVYYPEARNLLASHEVFNRSNDAQQISFDDFFFQRRFGSYIYKESNVYDNRRIGAYTSGVETLYEAERIKNEIFTYEHDLWEY